MAAVRLARAGASVTLFDPSHPREKPCGGGLTGRALALVADVIDIHALPAVVVNAATVEGPNRSARVALTDRGATPDSSLIVVSRALFDRALTDAAVAARARASSRNERLTSRRAARAWWFAPIALSTKPSTFSAPTEPTASCARSSRARSAARELSVAAGFFVHGATASTIAIKTMHEPPGYLWSFPRRDHLAIGVCAAAAHTHLVSPAARAVCGVDPGARPPPGHADRRRTPGLFPASAMRPSGRHPGRRGMDAARRCRGPGGSSDARRYLLRAPVRAVGSRGPAGDARATRGGAVRRQAYSASFSRSSRARHG